MKNKNETEKKYLDEKGSLTLETAIVLPIFIFILLFIYGFFWIISAQMQMSHALVQATKSLSMDSYIVENLPSSEEEDFTYWGDLSELVFDIVRSVSSSDYYSTQLAWYDGDSDQASEVAKKRFVAYLTGEDSDEEADEKLKNLGIEDGLDGVEFEVECNSDDTFSVTISYRIEYLFDFFGYGGFDMEQTISSVLWK